MESLVSMARDSLEFHVLEPTWNGQEITLRYALYDKSAAVLASFDEIIELPGVRVESFDATAFNRAVRLLALAASTSYYKACAPSTVVVETGLTNGERTFFAKVLLNGLAEFGYRNDIPEALRPTIRGPQRHDTFSSSCESVMPRRALIAVGGGKDSIVTIESVSELPVEITLFSVNEYPPIRATAEHANLRLEVASRRLDPGLFELNTQGALNGHVPVTAINSIIACLTAIHAGFDAVIFSNEASSSTGNLVWEGVDVNHQWSKGIEFEAMIRSLIGSASLSYFSFLRPLTELAITRRFAQLTSYHQVFTSCNRAFRLDPGRRRQWCGDCPKCRFVFLCLAPFVSRGDLLDIFGDRDLLDDLSQREGFLELLNVGNRLKPFECVGEPGECRAAVALLLRNPEWSDHPFFSDPNIAAMTVDDAVIADAFVFREPHFIPGGLEKAAHEIL